ncbi:MAG: serine/threonine protein kinase [Acidobacteria bacterium]|nr:serine/threonine protein kinase [Acidobacteriota bacterium]
MPDPANSNWARVQEIFLDAADLPQADRERYLNEQCAGDAPLRAGVDALLRADRWPVTELGSIIQDEARAMLSLDAAELRMPERIGPYRLIREIGSGGMGSVYLAERTDGEFEQQVAIKLIRREVATRETLARFRLERQILARLNHPNISRFLDGGVTADGQSYFVMEYIQGLRLDEYCGKHQLRTFERLALFRDVCAAVHYSHQNLIVHRDLKLSNVLVTADGVPKLLDFGVAKLLPAAGEGPQFTQSIAAALTPEYASPEQLSGDPITTASDIYSLGVILYRLLAGKSPYTAPSSNLVELARCIASEEPPLPSLAAKNPALRGDIDNIVLMALRKDPQRRYASVEALAEDLRRYLDGRPVSARTATVGYRVSKFIRRNPAIVAAGMVAVVALVAFLVQTRLQNQRLAVERDKAAKVAEFLSELFREAGPDRNAGKELTARQMLDRGAVEITKKGLANDPEMLGKVSNAIGRTYHELGLEPQAMQWYDKALAAYAAAGMAETDEAVDALNWLIGSKLWIADATSALELSRRAVDISRRLTEKRDSSMATSMTNLCASLRLTLQYDEATNVCRQQLDLAKRIYPPLSNNLSVAYVNMGGLLLSLDDKAAIEHFRASLAIKRQTLTSPNALLIPAIESLATALRSQERIAEAIPLAEEAVDLSRKLYPEGHKNLEASLWELGQCYMESRRFAEAEAALRESLVIIRRIMPAHPDLGFTLHALAVLRHRVGDMTGAAAYFEEALAVRKARQASSGYATVNANYALLLADSGRAQEAEARLRESMATHQRLLPPASLGLASTRMHLASVLVDGGNVEEAGQLIAPAEKMIEGYVVEDGWRQAFARAVRGAVRMRQGRLDEGRALLDAAYPTIVRRLGEKDYRSRWVARQRRSGL